MIVKICGIRTLEDALTAVDAGADMLGFNFYPPSPRYLEPETCREIVAGLKDAGKRVLNVGVFVNADPVEIASTLDTCGLDLAQLAGDEPLGDLIRLAGRAFKAVRPRSADDVLRVRAFVRLSQQPALLVDAYHRDLYGGSGQTGDWGLASQLAQDYPLLLAGGLNPENVAQAIRQVQPWGVDVASGVESTPGVKDPALMIAFVRAARSQLV